MQRKNPNRLQGRPSRPPGFTVVELLVVVAIVGLLLAMLLPALARSRERAREVICLRNQKQIHLAWTLYADENEGWLPAVRGGSFPGPDQWVSGWLDFSSSPDNTNTLYLTDPRFAQIGPYIGSAAPYRCPEDRSFVRMEDGDHQRVRSISMNCWVNYTGNDALGQDEYRIFRKLTEIYDPSPSKLWVFMDERPDSINDGMFITNPKARGKLAKVVDFPAGWHAGGAGVTFADGHGIIKRWEDARTVPELQPTQLLRSDVRSPDNPDVAWLQEHATSRRPIPSGAVR